MISTERQKEILNFLAKGENSKTIGKEMELSHRTVEKYIELMKLSHQAKSTTHLVAIALRSKLIK